MITASIVLLALSAWLLVRGADPRLDEIEERRKAIQWPAQY